MKESNDDFPNEIWVMKYKDTQIWGTKRAKDDEGILYFRDDTLHAPSYDKGYDANKKDYDEVWADLKKANDLIRELDDALRTEYYDREYDIETGHEIHRTNKQADQALRNAKEFLNEST